MKKFKDYFKFHSILNEMKKPHIDYVLNNLESIRPFENVFEGKNRILLNIGGELTYNKILEKIKKIKYFHSFDPKHGIIIKKIPIPEKYGGGIKLQKIKLGKAIEQLSIPEGEKKRYLNWYAKYISKIPEIEKEKTQIKYSIILSRDPVDVLKMSDFENTNSCHAPGEDYFQCAIEEAINGGGVAYVVPTKDLDNFTDDDLQKDEIFVDMDRSSETDPPKWLDPLSRLKLIRYVHEDGDYELAIPEYSIYGRDIRDFYETVRSFLNEKQKDVPLQRVRQDFSDRKIIRIGGSYYDNDDSSLFNAYYGVNDFYGEALHQTPEHEDYDASSIEIDYKIKSFTNDLNETYNAIKLYYNLEENDESVQGFANMVIDLPHGIILSDDYPINYEDYEDNNFFIKKFNPNRSYQDKMYSFIDDDTWSKLDQIFENVKHNNLSSEFNDNLLTITNGEDYDDYSSIVVWFGIDGASKYIDNVDEYYDFGRNMIIVDEEYEKIRGLIISAFVKSGFLMGTDKNFKPIKNIEEIVQYLNNFEYDDEELSIDARIQLHINDDLSKLNFNGHVSNDESEMTEDFIRMFENYVSLYYKPSIDKNLKLPIFKESYMGHVDSILKDLGILYISVQSFYLSSTNEPPFSYVYIYFNVMTEDKIPLIKFIDNSYNNISHMITYLVLKRLNKTSPQFKKLQQILRPIL